MTVVLAKFKLFYGAVPKAACTSINHMFFQAENGFEFRPFTANGVRKHIHNAAYRPMLRARYPEAQIENFRRVSVVRDPVKRFLSAYSNRVVALKELSMEIAGEKLRELDLAPDPDLDTFIDKFEGYVQAHDSIFHHTRPMADFIGDDEKYFTRIYKIEELDEFMQDMNDHMGTNLELGRMQTGGPKIGIESLKPQQLAKLKKLNEKDYEAFSILS
ncbi:Sulfotransferase family protein [Roseovarius litorisediminis]|uniref:Sulfotransferase family protein n=1 Tax=Roseovarius litorisediminis TaxID=1312363 RepID=A0A1Y5SR43_9RHOB|nr:sulfotransferase family 2 domain-containing protein [Roseovarius litorisediminis]SLN46060.1 Sulfotransferase family protein [Roseovarius litorisediminis]